VQVRQALVHAHVGAALYPPSSSDYDSLGRFLEPVHPVTRN